MSAMEAFRAAGVQVEVLPASVPEFIVDQADGHVRLVGSMETLRLFHTALGAELVLATVSLGNAQVVADFMDERERAEARQIIDQYLASREISGGRVVRRGS